MLTRSLVLLVCQFRHFRISHFIGNFQCGRWDLNPHERNAHKILSLARLPVPTLPHDRISMGFFIFSLATSDSIAKWILYVNTFFQKFCIFLFFLLFCHFYLWPCSFCFQEFFVCSYFGCRHFERTVGMFSILYFLLKEKAPTSVTDSHTPHTKKNPACKGYPVTESTVLTNSNHPNGRSDSKKNSIPLSIIDRKKISLAYYPMQKKESGCDSGQREIILIFYCIVSMCFTVVPFGQGFKDMSPPTKELMKLTLEQKLAHGGHPVLLSTMIEAFSSCKMQKLSNFNSLCISVHKLVFSVSLCYTLFTRRNAK